MPIAFLMLLRAWMLTLMLGLLPPGAQARAAAAAAIRLDDRLPSVDVRPAVTLLADPGHAMTLDDARKREADFRAPEGAASSLGRRSETIWLHLPLAVAVAAGDGQRLLDIAYPPLKEAKV